MKYSPGPGPCIKANYAAISEGGSQQVACDFWEGVLPCITSPKTATAIPLDVDSNEGKGVGVTTARIISDCSKRRMHHHSPRNIVVELRNQQTRSIDQVSHRQPRGLLGFSFIEEYPWKVTYDLPIISAPKAGVLTGGINVIVVAEAHGCSSCDRDSEHNEDGGEMHVCRCDFFVG